ncbi:MAG: hypothetical protein M1453_14710 [Acidobacteria bacterium]|nr:hypothetical protein [Acidobacteriota bacterium]MCL5289231.1 hypothetical protein [Acidobacteriota bacterium]
MTRRGSLAYYFAAITLGSFFLAVTYYMHFLLSGASRENIGRDFLVTFFFTVMLTVLPMLLCAFLLRRAAVTFRWQTPWPWMLAGAALFLALVQALGWLGNAVQTDRLVVEWWRMALTFVLMGPMLAIKQPWWLPLPAGALTAWLLLRTHRAFDERSSGL